MQESSEYFSDKTDFRPIDVILKTTNRAIFQIHALQCKLTMLCKVFILTVKKTDKKTGPDQAPDRSEDQSNQPHKTLLLSIFKTR